MAATDLRKKAALAASALLGLTVKGHAAPPDDDPSGWNVDTSVLSYSESNRIHVIEPTASVTRDFGRDRVAAMSLTVDTISGSTPIGTLPPAPTAAAAAGEPRGDSIAAASGGGSGGLSGGGGGGVSIDVPLAYMADVRYGMAGSWQQRIGAGVIGKIGGDVSLESDFRSFGANAALSRAFFNKNSTFALGVSPESDLSLPHGGVPVPLADPSLPGALDGRSSTKREIAYLIGLTQIVNHRTIMQFNYAQTKESGNLSDPYKLLSVIDPTTGDPLSSRYDSRPRSRLDRSFYWLTRYHPENDIVSASYRYYTDDWGIRSHTVDLSYRWNFNETSYLEPRFRFYHQNAADFYRLDLLSGDSLPAFASADYRLNKFDAYTVGVRIGHHIGEATEFVFRFDYMTQVGNGHPSDAIGIQKGFNLFPALQALIFQAQLRFDPSHVVDDIVTGLQE